MPTFPCTLREPMFTLAPRRPTVVLIPRVLKFTFRPGAIFTDLRKRRAMTGEYRP